MLKILVKLKKRAYLDKKISKFGGLFMDWGLLIHEI